MQGELRDRNIHLVIRLTGTDRRRKLTSEILFDNRLVVIVTTRVGTDVYIAFRSF